MEPLRIGNADTSARLGWQVTARGDVAEVELYDAIGTDFFGEGVNAADFIRDLRGLGNVRHINLHVNSPGGIVDDAKAIFHALQSHPATVNAYVEGVAASAASFIITAADTISIAPHARIQIHDAHAAIGVMSIMNSGDLDGLMSELRSMRNALDEESEDIAAIYAERAGGEQKEWRKRMQANGSMGTSYRGQEAVDAGLADEVTESTARNMSRVGAVANVAEVPPVKLTDGQPTQEPSPLRDIFASAHYPEIKPTDEEVLIDLLTKNPQGHGITAGVSSVIGVKNG